MESNEVDFTTFQLSGLSYKLWQTYESSTLAGATPLSWPQFSVLLLQEFIPQTRRDELCSEFENLFYKGMTAIQYAIRFTELSRYEALLISNERKSVCRFIKGLTYSLRFRMAREMETEATFHRDVEIARRMKCIYGWEREGREAKKPRDFGGFSGAYSGGKGQHGRGHFSRPVQPKLYV